MLMSRPEHKKRLACSAYSLSKESGTLPEKLAHIEGPKGGKRAAGSGIVRVQPDDIGTVLGNAPYLCGHFADILYKSYGTGMVCGREDLE